MAHGFPPPPQAPSFNPSAQSNQVTEQRLARERAEDERVYRECLKVGVERWDKLTQVKPGEALLAPLEGLVKGEESGFPKKISDKKSAQTPPITFKKDDDEIYLTAAIYQKEHSAKLIVSDFQKTGKEAQIYPSEAMARALHQEAPGKKVSLIEQFHVASTDGERVVNHILRIHNIGQFKGPKFRPQEAEFLALLGTTNSSSAIRLIQDHGKQFGISSIDWIQVAFRVNCHGFIIHFA
jgi:hypothetical protein